MCIDDGGATSAGQTKFVFWTCSSSNQNQYFVYDSTTKLLRNPTKNNLCIDDAGTTSPGTNRMHLWWCDTNNANQKFELVSISSPAPSTTSQTGAFTSFTKFMIKSSTKNNLCVDDYSREMKLNTCDPKNANQQFTYDTLTRLIKKSNENMCIDDGGATSAGQTKFLFWPCSSSNQNQYFVYDPATKLLRNPNKNNLCIDDAGTTSPGTNRMHLWWCDTNNANQKFELVITSSPTAVDSSGISALLSSNVASAIFIKCPQPIACPPGSTSCFPVDTKSWYVKVTYTNSTSKLLGVKDQYATALIDPNFATRFVSISSNGVPICTTLGPEVITTPIVKCEDNKHYFLTNYLGQSLSSTWNPAFNGVSQIQKILVADSVTPNAKPEILSTWGYHTGALYESKNCASIPLATSQKVDKFFKNTLLFCENRNDFYRVSDNNDLIVVNHLKIGNYVLAWRKDAKYQMDLFKAAPQPGCLFNSQGVRSAYCTLPAEIIFIDDCEAATAGSSSPTRFLDAISLSPSQENGQYYTCDNDLSYYIQPDYLTFPSKFMIRVASKTLCAQDYSGDVKTNTCDPNNANQQFNYDVQTKLIKRDNSNLCLNDGGATLAGQTTFITKTCDASDINQQFLYDPKNRMFTNPNKDFLCLDDAGATSPGTTRMQLSGCNNKNANQILDIAASTFPSLFMLKNSQNGLCISTANNFLMQHPCHPWNTNLHFSYNNALRQLRSRGRCLLDGWLPELQGISPSLQVCRTIITANQQYVYDFNAKTFRNPVRNNLCLHTNDGMYGFATSEVCDANNPRQKYELVPVLAIERKIFPSVCSGTCLLSSENDVLRHEPSGFQLQIVESVGLGQLILYEVNAQNQFSERWRSYLATPHPGPYKLVVQNDGNLVLFGLNNGFVWASNTNGPNDIYVLSVTETGLKLANLANTRILWTVAATSSVTIPPPVTLINTNLPRFWQYLKDSHSLRNVEYEDLPKWNELLATVPAIADCSDYKGYFAAGSLSKRAILASMPNVIQRVQFVNMTRLPCTFTCIDNGLALSRGRNCHLPGPNGHFKNMTTSNGSYKLDCIDELMFSCAPGMGIQRTLCGNNGECTLAQRLVYEQQGTYNRLSVCRGAYDSLFTSTVVTNPFRGVVAKCRPWASQCNAIECNNQLTSAVGTIPYQRNPGKARIYDLHTFLTSVEGSPLSNAADTTLCGSTTNQESAT